MKQRFVTLGIALIGFLEGSIFSAPVLGAGFPSAAATPTAYTLVVGRNAGLANGDYVTSNTVPGLNTVYQYWIEVPPGLPRLVVDIWDADAGSAGEGPTPSVRDAQNGGAWDSNFRYRLFTPANGTQATIDGGPGTPAGANNAWTTLASVLNPAAGHWRVEVSSRNVGTEDDINAFAIRAHDGTPGSGGTELNVYAEGILNIGTANDPVASYTFHPYVVSGCDCRSLDFDSDGAGGYALTSRTGAFSQGPLAPSGGTVWANVNVAGWTSAQNATDYGIWRGTQTKPLNSRNFYDYFLASFSASVPANGAAGPPPNANPVPGAFRLYFPTDAGAAPVKPYLEQVARYVSGDNPPAANKNTIMRVTVYLVNPTPYPITFSTPNNLVRTSVPTLRLEYRQNSTVSQGLITAQPGMNGTGLITWNPGTVLAGATAWLAYDVRVRPTTNAETTNLTPPPTDADSTRATFVDETGNTTQARATFTLGPLCQLSITSGVRPTLAVVSAFAARTARRGTLVEWTTVAAAGTAGFVLERMREGERDFRPVHPRMLGAVLDAPVGATYRFLDEDVTSGETVAYRLVEVEGNGTRLVYGPWRSEIDDSGAALERPGDEGFSATRHPRVERFPTPGKELPVIGKKTPAGLKVETATEGIHLVPSTQIAEILGTTPTDVARLLRTKGLELTNRGRSIPWTTPSDSSGLVFWAEDLADAYAPTNAYILRRGSGREMKSDWLSPRSKSTIVSAPETLHIEQDLLAATLFPADTDGDYWFWDFLQAGSPSTGHKSYELTVPGVVDGPSRVSLTLAGGSTTGIAGEHHVRASLNGVFLGEVRFEGSGAAVLEGKVPAGILREGANVLDLVAELDSRAPYSTVLFDSVDISYERSTRAVGSAIVVRPASDGLVTVNGLADPDVLVLRVTTPAEPVIVKGAQGGGNPGNATATFPAERGEVYAVCSRAGLLAARGLGGETIADLRDRRNAAEWLVLTTDSLAQGAATLAGYRRAQGLSTMVVDVEAVYDEFGYGLRTPKAIRDFLAFATARWSVRPKYVLLAGAGDFDFKGSYGLGGNLLPPLMVSTPGGILASDNALADWGSDGVPAIAIGRLPVRTNAELLAYLEKVRTYESPVTPGASERTLLVADNTEDGVDFAADCDTAGDAFPAGWSRERIYLGPATLSAARAGVLTGWNSGASAVTFFGHGGFDRLAAEGILTSADIDSLSTPTPPVVTGLSCFIGRFDVPGYTSLGQTLVNTAGRGSVAVWAGSGWSSPTEARLLGREFGRIAWTNKAPTLGVAIRNALSSYVALGGTTDITRTFVLLGDPALRLRTPSPVTPAPQDGSL